MTFKKLISLRGINVWYLFSGMFLNLFWSVAIALIITSFLLNRFPLIGGMLPVILLVVAFSGPFLIGWIIGKLAGDNRGPTYGIYGSLGSVVVLAVTALPAGLVGLTLIGAAIAGGLNGGLLSLSRR